MARSVAAFTSSWKLSRRSQVIDVSKVSLMIAAGVNAKALSVYMGHASVMITLDRYGHLFPGNEEEAAGLLDTHSSRAAASVD